MFLSINEWNNPYDIFLFNETNRGQYIDSAGEWSKDENIYFLQFACEYSSRKRIFSVVTHTENEIVEQTFF